MHKLVHQEAFYSTESHYIKSLLKTALAFHTLSKFYVTNSNINFRNFNLINVSEYKRNIFVISELNEIKKKKILMQGSYFWENQGNCFNLEISGKLSR